MVLGFDPARLKRLSLWIVVILYTASLPEFIRLYDWIVSRFSEAFAFRLPLLFVIAFFALFTLYCILAGKGSRGLIHIFLCICIAAVIFQIVEIPNKRSHIPEYVLMSWLLFEALKGDYRGKGGLLLILVLSSLLGIVDEVVQGFHPRRYYGYADMAVNSLSSAIGVLLLAVVRKPFPSNNTMEVTWKPFWAAILMNAMGAVGISLSCYYLRAVAAHNTFFTSFPASVIALDIIGCIGIIVFIFFFISFHSFRRWYIPSSRPAAMLWLLVPKSIFLIIMGLTVAGYFFGLEFQ
ncbi:MAG: VanZ family protein [Deltaproteobacteria bacterium]|nr:VanZ family protein [Deltaproteobacteria bacterium]MBW2307771.1 VanZ family protein [Deltaproteobacteria bacterium]